MLQASEVEHSYTTIRATTYENINAVCTESDIKNFFVVRDQLRFGCECRYVPYGTSSIDTRGYD